MAQRHTTIDILACKLQRGDVILERREDQRGKETTVHSLSFYRKCATRRSKTHHTGCRGVHVNGSACWEANDIVTVTRAILQKNESFLASIAEAMLSA